MSAILLLDYLKKSTSRRPMSLSELNELSGITIEVIKQCVKELIGRGMIATADITRNTVTQTYLWPTGVSKPYNIATDYKISPKRHDLLKLEEATIPSLTTTPYAPISRTLQILQYIENNPNCPYADFKDVLKIEGASGYIGNHIERGNVIKTNISPRKNTYALKAGKTAKEVYNGGTTGNGGAKKISPVKLCDHGDHSDVKMEFAIGDGSENKIKLNAQCHIEMLLIELPIGHELLIVNNKPPQISIMSPDLLREILVPLDKINETLEVLNKLNKITTPCNGE
jgi:hypothetical protein